MGGDSVIFSIGCDGQGEEKVGVVLLLGIYLEINFKLLEVFRGCSSIVQ